ncbi:hypothetical protein ABMA28_011302 [Loxostege sticticalis]|uniref:SAM domain-containing protein n=1 Tax=Loxostege sticticalis TaxID=481309 RepID=A0ABD0SAS0_LOXSC
MQQPMSQHDQMAAPQAQQQMVLCPVRLVYETQILVQPGDQIQPNQTLFINPQNPPPWAQNRQVQQQNHQPVIYVQQMANNMMPMQQHVDQQQLYLQQFQNFQQIIPQQMMQQQQERQNQIQIPNLIHQNMLNFQTNIGQNIQLQDRGMQQVNFAQAHPNIGANIRMQNQTQISLPNNNAMRQNEMPNTVQVPQQNQVNRVEVKQPYQQANVGHINQQQMQRPPQPQVLTVNPMQNVPQTINIQSYAPNMINRPIKTENASSQASMPTFVNAAQNTNITRIRKVAPATNINKMNTPTVGIRHVSQPYRPIQPRPQHYRQHLPNYPMEHQPTNQPQTTQSMPVMNQNVININSHIPVTPVVPNIQMQSQNTIKPEENNRKRKSESPDEIHKKMAAIQVNSNVPMKQINIVQSAEIGTNTSPVHKKDERLSMPILFSQERPPEVNEPPEKNNMSALIQNVQNAIKVDKVNMIKPNEDPKDSTQNNVADKEKLVRNTVFTQARGRVLTDKEIHNTVTINEITITPKEEKPQTHDVVKVESDKVFKTPNPVANDKAPDTGKVDTFRTDPATVNTSKTDTAKVDSSRTNTAKVNTSITNIAKVETPRTDTAKTDDTDTDKQFNITNVVKTEKGVNETKVETKEREMNVSLNTTNNKGMFPMEKCEQEKDYILTHVLDGIVIQESNVAFPIREPVTRRVVQQTPVSNERRTRKGKSKEKEKKQEEEAKKEEEEVCPTAKTDEKDKMLVEVADGDAVSPFSNISPATLKSWTTSELSAHLAKHKWEETAALFQDHEIDGESLFLVSKSQLQNIGVKENQAEIICAFVKS